MLTGEINVARVMQEAQRRVLQETGYIRRLERIEDSEALRWLYRAKDRADRELVKELYKEAFARMRQTT